jgi:hypothetical protein
MLEERFRQADALQEALQTADWLTLQHFIPTGPCRNLGEHKAGSVPPFTFGILVEFVYSFNGGIAPPLGIVPHNVLGADSLSHRSDDPVCVSMFAHELVHYLLEDDALKMSTAGEVYAFQGEDWVYKELGGPWDDNGWYETFLKVDPHSLAQLKQVKKKLMDFTIDDRTTHFVYEHEPLYPAGWALKP